MNSLRYKPEENKPTNLEPRSGFDINLNNFSIKTILINLLKINELSNINAYLARIFIFIKIIMSKGTVKFFNESKGFGFIKDSGSDKEYFVHVSGLNDQVRENDEVTFDLQEGQKGLNAVNVKLA